MSERASGVEVEGKTTRVQTRPEQCCNFRPIEGSCLNLELALLFFARSFLPRWLNRHCARARVFPDPMRPTMGTGTLTVAAARRGTPRGYLLPDGSGAGRPPTASALFENPELVEALQFRSS